MINIIFIGNKKRNLLILTFALISSLANTQTITVDSQIDPVCNGDNNGSISITVTDGVEPYTYNWNTSDGGGLVNGDEDQTNLLAGTYNLTVTDNTSNTSNITITLTNPSPVIVTATSNSPICEGTNLTLSEIGGEVTQWVWTSSTSYDPPDIQNPNNANSTPTESGTYTVVGTVTATGCSAQDVVTVIINETPEINAGVNDTICSDDTYALSGTYEGSDIIWTGGAGVFDDNTSLTAVYTPTAAEIANGSVTLTIHSTDNLYGCVNVTDEMVLAFFDAAEVNAGTDGEICANETFSLNGTLGGTTENISWTTSGDGFFDNNTSLTAVYTPGVTDITNGSVVLTISSDNPFGCGVVTDEMEVIVNPLPIADFTVTTPIETGENSIITYTGETSSYDIYNWDFDESESNPTDQGPHNISWSTFGTKDITLTITNDKQCVSNLVNHNVIVNPTSVFSISNNEVCVDISTTITYIGTGLSSSNYIWDFDGGTIISGSGQGPYEILWTTSGTKNISLQVIDGVYTSSVTQNSILVNSLPIAGFTVTPSILTSENSIITYTGETSLNDTYTWDFDGTTTNPTGIGPHNVNWNTGGLKTVELVVTNDNGCISTMVSQNVAVTPESNFTLASEICKNSNTTLTYADTSSPTATYTWDFDGATSSPSGQGPHDISWNTIGTKTITLTVEENGYTSTETTHQIVVNSLPIIDMDASLNICHNQTDIITPTITNGTTPYLYNWSNGESAPTITVNDVVEDYYLTVTDNKGCTATDVIHTNVFYPYSNQQLCLVSVDPATGKNKIVWEPNDNVGTESYVIQKALSTDNYTPLDIIDADQPSEYIDWGSDPAAHADFYKITVLDTCGNQSDIENSVYHKTINLVLSNVGSTMSLNWEQYEVEDDSYVPATYKIFRGTEATNMVEIAEINGMLSSYNDLDVYQVYHYMVGAVRSDCSDSGKSMNTEYTIFSNEKDNTELVTEIIENSIYMPIQIYPNPAKDQIQLSIGDLQLKESKVIITDISGETVLTVIASEASQSIDISALNSGTYFLTIKSDKIYKGKFVKE